MSIGHDSEPNPIVGQLQLVRWRMLSPLQKNTVRIACALSALTLEECVVQLFENYGGDTSRFYRDTVPAHRPALGQKP